MEGKNLQQEVAELKNLTKRNIEYSKKILEMEEKQRRYILWIKIINLIKLFIILIPIILALIYLPPIVQDFFAKYKELFGPGGFFLEFLQR